MARRKNRKIDLEQEIQRLERELEHANRQIHDTQSSRVSDSQDYTNAEKEKPRGKERPRVTVSLPPQEHYDGHQRPWESFIFSFRSMAATCEWDEREQRFRLLACLRGDAADFVFQQLSAEVVNDLDQLIVALEGRFAARKTPSAFVSQLEARRLGAKETIAEYAADIRRLTTFGYPTADHATLEMIATRHFLRGLGDNSMSMTIGLQEPKTLQEAREIAERFHHLREETIRNNPRSVRAVSSSESNVVNDEKLVSLERRLLSNIDNKITQLSEDIRKQLQHGGRESRTGQGQWRGRPQARSSPIRCFECREEGHIARNCPLRRYYYEHDSAQYPPPHGPGPSWEPNHPQGMPNCPPQQQWQPPPMQQQVPQPRPPQAQQQEQRHPPPPTGHTSGN